MNIPDVEPESDRQSFCFSVADIKVAVRCNHAAVLEDLRTRYHHFLVEGDQIQLTLHVDVGRERHAQGSRAGEGPRDPIFNGRVLHFSDPDYQGYVDLEQELARLAVTASEPAEGARPEHFGFAQYRLVEGIEYFLRVIYALLAFQAGGLLFHAAGVVRHGRACLFFGPSGSGKTSISRLSPDGVVLNDDLVILMPHEGGWIVHGTPFWNPTQVIPSAQSAPLGAMFALVKDKRVYVEKMGRGQAIAELISNVPVIPADPARSHNLLERCENLLDSVPVSRLHFLQDDTFWDVVDIGRPWSH